MSTVSPDNGSDQQAPLLPGSGASEVPKKAADYMLLFYWDKDGQEPSDSDKTVNGVNVLKRIFVHEKECKEHFKEILKVCEGNTSVKMKDLRNAALNDFKVWLPRMGFTIQCFKSIDEDELFMRVSLEELEVQKFYAERSKVYLQLSRECIEKMGITYPTGTDERFCSPPYLAYEDRFDEQKVKELGCTKSSIFRNHFRLRNPNGSILRSVDSIRIIKRTINRLLDLDDMCELGILAGKYPIHVRAPLDDLRTEWATFQCSKLFNIWAPLPLTRIRNYFGESVAFFFAWLAHTVRSVAILAVFAAIWKAGLVVADMSPELHAYDPDFWGQLSFGIVMAGWGTAYVLTWKREEHYFNVDWNMLDLSDRAALRPDFAGELQPSPLNINVETKQYPENKTAMYKTISSVMTGVFLFIAVSTISATRGLEPILQPILREQDLAESYAATATSIVISIEIQVFSQIWNKVGRWLVKLENPRTDFEYHDALIWKLAPFTLICTYNTFIYIAIFQKYLSSNYGTKQCGTDGANDCIAYLQTSLYTTFLTQGAMIIVGMAVPYIMLWRELKTEADEVKKRCEAKGLTDVPQRCFMEKQAKMGIFDADAEIGEYMTTITVLGYVLLFGATAPATIVIALVILLFQLRATAYKLTKLSRRPFPLLKRGIGSWSEILESLTWAGLLFYVGIPIMNGHLIEHWPSQWKAVAVFTVEHAVVFAKFAFSSMISMESSDAQLLAKRRQYCKDKLLIGKDDPDTLNEKYKKQPVSVDPKDVCCLNKEKAPAEWEKVDRTPMVTLCGSSTVDKIVRPLMGDRNDYV